MITWKENRAYAKLFVKMRQTAPVPSIQWRVPCTNLAVAIDNSKFGDIIESQINDTTCLVM